MGERVLLVGNGAREHIMATALSRDAVLLAYMAHDHPGIRALAQESLVGSYEDIQGIAAFGKRAGATIAIIGPEAPLALGVVDALEAEGIPCVGPRKDLAQLESSKSFTRDLLDTHRIPGNPRFKVFIEPTGIEAWITELGEYVVKADGLRSGKGVKVSGAHLATPEEGIAYAQACLAEDGKVVIEERLDGEEFSLMAFTDGTTIVSMPCVQDHKRAHEGDTGPNTGGMGTYTAPDHALPFLTPEDITQAKTINGAVVRALGAMGTYKGIVYGGFMATKDGVKLIEYNARLGDPEAMNVLTLLETSLTQTCRAIVDGTLKDLPITFTNEATVCKYVVPKGYPDSPVTGPISIPATHDAACYLGAIGQGMQMLGSRALAIVGRGTTIAAAEQQAESTARAVTGEVFHRTDIGTDALIAQRIMHMKRLRG